MLTRNGEHCCRHRMPARLPRLVQPGGHGQQGPGRRDRWLDAEHAHRRLHLRESQEFRRPCVRRCAAAISRRSDRTERTRAVPPHRAGTKRSSSLPPACSRCASAGAAKPSFRFRTADRTACSRRTRSMRCCSAGSAHRGWRARCAPRRPASPRSRCTERCPRSPTRTIRTRSSSSSGV